jgi:hypothetical protein
MKPSIPAAISGRLVGIEFSCTKGGIVVKRRKPPRQMDSRREIEARTVFYRRANDWSAMTREAMLEWNAYAATHPVVNRLGQTRYLSGYNWFMKLRDTPDGILLPIGTLPSFTFGYPDVYDGGPYSFEINWCEGVTDDDVIKVWFGWLKPNYRTPIPRVWWYGGAYTKAGIAALNYETLTALGIGFHDDEQYVMTGYIWRTRYFCSAHSMILFTTTSHNIWWLAMDDAKTNPIVHDSMYLFPQTFLDPTGDPDTIAHAGPGVHDGALYFDGLDDQIQLTSTSYEPYLDTGKDFTLCLWWKPTLPISPSYRFFLSNGALFTQSIEFGIRQNSSIILFCFLYNSTKWYTSVAWPESNVSIWQHYAVVRVGTNLKVYKNGIIGMDADNVNIQGKLWKTGNPLSIGCQTGITYFAAGAADDVRLYDIGLSAAQVAALAVP